MSIDTTETVKPRLWIPDGFRVDEWRRADTAEALEDAGKLILPLSVFQELDPVTRYAALPRLGVEVLPGESIDPLLCFLDRLPLVALVFPAFNDGRSYSKAELLRTRYAYRGEIRAVGDVLTDQIPHMLRCGFSSLEVTNPATLDRLEAGRRDDFLLHYQPSAVSGPRTGGYSWRRAARQG